MAPFETSAKLGVHVNSAAAVGANATGLDSTFFSRVTVGNSLGGPQDRTLNTVYRFHFPILTDENEKTTLAGYVMVDASTGRLLQWYEDLLDEEPAA